MVEEQKPRRLREEDCLIDWKNHPAEDENGNPIVEDWTELRNEWLQEDCECNEYSLANRERCYRYYSFDYDENLFKQWMKQHNYTENNIAYWGLERMFDDGWIKSPAFVDWRDFKLFYNIPQIKSFIESITAPEMRVAILSYFIKNADYLFGGLKKELSPGLKQLHSIHQEAIKVHKEELKRQAEESKARNKEKREKPEYVLSIDEIIKYVQEENPESASVIRGMLRYFAFEKDGWSNASIKNKIREIDHHILVQGDYIAGDKHVGTHIDNVSPGAIGAQTTKD